MFVTVFTVHGERYAPEFSVRSVFARTGQVDALYAPVRNPMRNSRKINLFAVDCHEEVIEDWGHRICGFVSR